MKKEVRYLGYLLVFCTLLFICSFAIAREDVIIDIVSYEPSEMAEPGIITVTFEISNHSDYELTDISIIQESSVFDCPDGTVIPCAGSARIPVAFNITDDKIGKPIVFTVSWICGGEPFTENKELIIERSNEPVITLVRSISCDHARIGRPVTITYTLKNDTRFDMTEITLIDEKVSDSPIRKNETIRANDSITVDYTCAMRNEALVSMPIVTYVVNGKTKTHSATLPEEVAVSNASVKISASQGNINDTGTEFKITVENTGNVNAHAINIYDSTGNKVNNSDISLEVGEKKSIHYTFPPLTSNQVEQIYFRFTGYDDFDELLDPANTGFFSIYPYIDDAQFRVTVECKENKPWSPETQTIILDFSLLNESLVALNTVVLSETQLGELYRWETLPTGFDTIRIELPTEFPRELSFSLVGTDFSGISRNLSSFTYTISETNINAPIIDDTVSSPLPELKEDDKTSLFGDNPIWNNMIFRILIIFGALMILSMCVLLSLNVIEKGRTEATGIDITDEDEYEDTEDWDSIFNDGGNTDFNSSDIESSMPVYDTNSIKKEAKVKVRTVSKAPSPRSIIIKKEARKLPAEKITIKRISHNE